MNYDFEKIPATLRGLQQWVCWRAVKRKSGKTDKLPIDPKTGDLAKSNDQNTWASFEETVDYWLAHKGTLDGIGFVFTTEDPYCGLDLDHCVTDGELESWAQRILKKLNTYTEMSPSENGVHAIIKIQGKLPPSKRKGRIEFYSHGRFFTMTGNRLDGFKPYIHELTIDEMKSALPELFKAPAKLQKKPSLATPQLSDDEILRLCKQAQNGNKFERLWQGDISDYPSQSEADQALCSILSFYSQSSDQIDRLFRQCRLYREKWDEKRGAKTYGQLTIEKALERTSETYSHKKHNKKKIVLLSKFSPRPYSQQLLEKYQLVYDRYKRFWVFDEDTRLWREDAELVLEFELRQNLLGEEQLKRHYIEEILADVKSLVYTPETFPEPDPNLIPFANGVFDLSTNELRGIKPDDYFTLKLPVNYNPDAKCPIIDKVFSELVDDPTDLYELTAYCLWRGYPYQKLFFLYGSGGNGKSVFLRILGRLLGNENIKAIDLHQLTTNRFAGAGLHNKLAAICGEAKYKQLNDTDLLKKLTGDDVINAERKYQNSFDFINYAKILVNTNELPRTADKTRAFYRRLYLINFPNVFEGTQKEDKTLLSKITPPEIEGLATKAIRHLQKLKSRGFFFTNDKPTEELERTYESLTNPLAEFLNTYTVEDPEGMIPRHHLREAFNLWQKSRGMRVWIDRELTQEMKLLGYTFKQRTVDYQSTTSQLSQVSQHISNKIYKYKKLFKTPVKPVKRVKGNPIWRCWLGLAWALPQPCDYKDRGLALKRVTGGTHEKPTPTVVKNRKPAQPCGLTPKSGGLTQEPEWLKQDFGAIDSLSDDIAIPLETDALFDVNEFEVVKKGKK